MGCISRRKPEYRAPQANVYSASFLIILPKSFVSAVYLVPMGGLFQPLNLMVLLCFAIWQPKKKHHLTI